MDQEMLEKTGWNVFETVCKTLDERGMKYERDDEKLVDRFGVRGDDFSFDVIVRVIPGKQVVQMTCPAPYRINEGSRKDAAIAITMINYQLLNGCFDFDMSDGFLVFRMCQAYHGSILGTDVFDYMLNALFYTVDEYFDKLFLISKGGMTIEQLAEKLEED